jgi:hypothetical protein
MSPRPRTLLDGFGKKVEFALAPRSVWSILVKDVGRPDLCFDRQVVDGGAAMPKRAWIVNRGRIMASAR